MRSSKKPDALGLSFLNEQDCKNRPCIQGWDCNPNYDKDNAMSPLCVPTTQGQFTSESQCKVSSKCKTEYTCDVLEATCRPAIPTDVNTYKTPDLCRASGCEKVKFARDGQVGDAWTCQPCVTHDDGSTWSCPTCTTQGYQCIYPSRLQCLRPDDPNTGKYKCNVLTGQCQVADPNDADYNDANVVKSLPDCRNSCRSLYVIEPHYSHDPAHTLTYETCEHVTQGVHNSQTGPYSFLECYEQLWANAEARRYAADLSACNIAADVALCISNIPPQLSGADEMARQASLPYKPPTSLCPPPNRQCISLIGKMVPLHLLGDVQSPELFPGIIDPKRSFFTDNGATALPLGLCLQARSIGTTMRNLQTTNDSRSTFHSLATDSSITGSYSSEKFALKASVEVMTNNSSEGSESLKTAVVVSENQNGQLFYDLEVCNAETNINPEYLRSFLTQQTVVGDVVANEKLPTLIRKDADWESYKDHAKVYGTHIIISAILGTTFKQVASTKSTEANALKALKVKACVSASGSSGDKSAKFDGCSAYGTESQDHNISESISENRIVKGGIPGLQAKLATEQNLQSADMLRFHDSPQENDSD